MSESPTGVDAHAIIAATLRALPVGYLPNHTPESLPERVADLVARYAEAERQRHEWMDCTIDALAQVGNLTEQRDAYTETLRFMAETDEDWNLIRERHPELAGNAELRRALGVSNESQNSELHEEES